MSAVEVAAVILIGGWLTAALIFVVALVVASDVDDSRLRDEGWDAHCADALHVGNDEPVPYQLTTAADEWAWGEDEHGNPIIITDAKTGA